MLGLLTPEPTPPPAPPRPIPFVTEARYIQNLLANNECLITVKNEGAAGRVTVEVYTEIDRGGDHERGESGLERWKRETFTRKSEPEPVYRPQLERTRQGWTEFHMEAGEEKAVRLELKYYRMMDGLQGNRLQVDAKGYPPASL